MPDPDRSRALLIGTSAHTNGSDLPSLPAIEANLAHLRQVLTDPATGSLPPEHCITVADPATVSEAGSLLAHVAQEATDLLFVYYGGHGLVDDRGRLHLALPHTDTANIRWTALSFETLREELLDSPASIRVLVLDCCFSGRATEAMTGGHGTVAGQLDVAGTYTLASTAANAVAYAPQGTTHTAFTGALLAALRGPEPLNLDDLFEAMRRDLAARGMPRPQRRVINNAGDLVLVRASEPAAPRPAPAIDPGASASARPPWLKDSAAAQPEPPRPKKPIRRIPVWVWSPLIVVAPGLVFGYWWIYTQTHWDRNDLKSTLQHVATTLEEDPWTSGDNLGTYMSGLIDRTGKNVSFQNISVDRVSYAGANAKSSAGDYSVTDMEKGLAFCMHVAGAPDSSAPSTAPRENLTVNVTDGACPTAGRPSTGQGSSPSSTP
nr:caspase family protein [Streptomyces sp. SID8354]